MVQTVLPFLLWVTFKGSAIIVQNFDKSVDDFRFIFAYCCSHVSGTSKPGFFRDSLQRVWGEYPRSGRNDAGIVDCGEVSPLRGASPLSSDGNLSRKALLSHAATARAFGAWRREVRGKDQGSENRVVTLTSALPTLRSTPARQHRGALVTRFAHDGAPASTNRKTGPSTASGAYAPDSAQDDLPMGVFTPSGLS